MMGWVDRLKARWNVQSTVRLVIVLAVFSLTGMSILLIKPLILGWLFDGQSPSGWWSLGYYSISPLIYNALLLFYGTLFGQFSFFWAFEKRAFQRIARWLGRKKEATPPKV